LYQNAMNFLFSYCNEHLIWTKFSNDGRRIQWLNSTNLKPKFDFFFQRLLQSFVHTFYHNDIVWFKKIVFCHSCISLLSKCIFKWFEIGHIQWLKCMWSVRR
jgi:hypothetical protein